MLLPEAYQNIWRQKLESIRPPHQQSIPRCNQAFDLLTEHHARVGRMSGWLLDVGTGSGAILAKAKASGFQARGVDFHGPLLDWLRGHGYDVSTCDLNVDHLPEAGFSRGERLEALKRPMPNRQPNRSKAADPDGYQCVVCCDVIEHLIDPQHLLNEMYRVLAIGGHCYVSTPNAAYWQRIQQLIGGEMFRTSGDNVLRDGGHLSYWAEKDLGAALKSAGFREVGFQYHGGSRGGPASLRRGPWNEGAHMLAWAVK